MILGLGMEQKHHASNQDYIKPQLLELEILSKSFHVYKLNRSSFPFEVWRESLMKKIPILVYNRRILYIF